MMCIPRSVGTAFAMAAMMAVATPVAAQDTNSAEMVNADGETIGTLTLTETPNGVLIQGDLQGLTPGELGFHFHETGQCEPPFESAGGHFNPGGVSHGYMLEDGPHAGDMPNIHVPESGNITIEVFNPYVRLVEGEDGYLLDDDGSAVMIHSGADDYESQPSGDAGDRIACGVVQ